MAERPASSNNFLAQYNDVLRRLRDVERELLIDPDVFTPLQTYEDGSPLGDTRFLDFGANLKAVLTADGYVKVDAATPGGSGFDAIVDETFAASDPEAREYQGIAEALVDLAADGFTRAFVLVRPGTYVDTGAKTVPGNITLVSTSDWMEGPSWDHSAATFNTVSGQIEWVLWNMTLSNGGVLGEDVTAYNCAFAHNVATAAASVHGTYVTLTSCHINGMRPLASTTLNMVGCDVHISGSDPAITFLGDVVIRSSVFYGNDGFSNANWTTSTKFDVELFGPTAGAGKVSSTALGVINFTVPTTATFTRIHAAMPSNNINVTAASNGRPVYLEGTFGNVTLGGTLADSSTIASPHRVNINSYGTLDLAVAVINISRPGGTAGGGQITFRGGVSGNLHLRNPVISSGTLLDFVSATFCSIAVTAGNGAATGTAKPFAFDGASNNNMVIFPNTDSWPVAGTGAGGTNDNYVLPEDADDMVGSGGHVIQDEGVSLPQRTNLNFVGAGVTVTDDAGNDQTDVTIPGGGGGGDTLVAWVGV